MSGQHHVARAILASLPQQHLRRHRRRRVRERWWARWRGEYWIRVVEWMDRDARREAAARMVDAVFTRAIVSRITERHTMHADGSETHELYVDDGSDRAVHFAAV